MSASTYDEAITHVLASEGGYTNDARDPGGPTNWGITIHDAREFWKVGASAADVKAMPLSVAKEIYRKHYAAPVGYDALPAGLDYAVLDYGVNSGVSRALKVLKTVQHLDPASAIKALCDERLRFLRGLSTWGTFGKGWGRRVAEVRAIALHMAERPANAPTPRPTITEAAPGKSVPSRTVTQSSPVVRPLTTPATPVAKPQTPLQKAPKPAEGPKPFSWGIWAIFAAIIAAFTRKKS